MFKKYFLNWNVCAQSCTCNKQKVPGMHTMLNRANVVYMSPPKTHCRSGNTDLQQLWGKFTHQVPTSLTGTFKTRDIFLCPPEEKKKSIKIYTHTHIQKQDAPKPGLNLLSEGRDLNPNYGQVFPSRLSTDFVSYFLLVVSAVGTFHCN